MAELKGKAAWLAGGLGAAAIVVLCVWLFRGYFGQSQAGADSHLRWFVCSETRKPFQQHVDVGMSFPIQSPFTHKLTGYPAELCYWTKDGTPKDTPTPVLLNSELDPNDRSPTFCPDCGRLVVGHNPPATPGGRPPPTREEWAQSHAGAAGR